MQSDLNIFTELGADSSAVCRLFYCDKWSLGEIDSALCVIWNKCVIKDFTRMMGQKHCYMTVMCLVWCTLVCHWVCLLCIAANMYNYSHNKHAACYRRRRRRRRGGGRSRGRRSSGKRSSVSRSRSTRRNRSSGSSGSLFCLYFINAHISNPTAPS